MLHAFLSLTKVCEMSHLSVLLSHLRHSLSSLLLTVFDRITVPRDWLAIRKEGGTLKFSLCQIVLRVAFYLKIMEFYYFAHHKTVSFHILWHVCCCLEQNPRAVFLFQSRQPVQNFVSHWFQSFRHEKICKHGSSFKFSGCFPYLVKLMYMS